MTPLRATRAQERIRPQQGLAATMNAGPKTDDRPSTSTSETMAGGDTEGTALASPLEHITMSEKIWYNSNGERRHPPATWIVE